MLYIRFGSCFKELASACMQPSCWCHFQFVVLTGQQDDLAEEEMKTGTDSQSCMEIEGIAYALKPKSKINRQKQ